VLAGFATMQGPVKTDAEKRMPVGVLVATSLAIGAMTGVFGVGGGFLAIPVLVLFFNTPQNKAAGTSLLIISINSLTSFLGHHSIWHEVKWGIPIGIVATAVVVSLIASHNVKRVPVLLLRKSFSYFLFALAIFTVAKTWIFHA
jgi:uncharacterized membrane protein YfcA